MTAKQGVSIASRILTVYFLTLAAYRFTDMPVAIMSLLHSRSEIKSPPKGYVPTSEAFYYFRVAIESIAHSALIISLTLFMAWTFYRCGPGIAKFLLSEQLEPETCIDPHGLKPGSLVD